MVNDHSSMVKGFGLTNGGLKIHKQQHQQHQQHQLVMFMFHDGRNEDLFLSIFPYNVVKTMSYTIPQSSPFL
jgi:hypothetical protein